MYENNEKMDKTVLFFDVLSIILTKTHGVERPGVAGFWGFGGLITRFHYNKDWNVMSQKDQLRIIEA